MSGALPDGACDAHCHVFGPRDLYPYAPSRTYNPDDVPREKLFALHRHLGIDRAVIVQPAAHGFDNRVTLDAIAASEGRCRGIALVREDVTVEDIAALDVGGIRGIRFNFTPHLGPMPDAGTVQRLAELVAPFGWHIAVHMVPDAMESVRRAIENLPVPAVIDHMARIDAAAGTNQGAFRDLVDLLENPSIWVKISAADRASAAGSPYLDVLPFMRRLLLTAPDRTLWGTDFPHPNIKGPIPSKETLLYLLYQAVADADALRRVLVDNPARLYGFAE